MEIEKKKTLQGNSDEWLVKLKGNQIRVVSMEPNEDSVSRRKEFSAGIEMLLIGSRR